MESENGALVHLAIEALSCTQKELALQLQVSPALICKGKNGDHLSDRLRKQLRTLADIGDKDPIFVYLAGSMENARKWEKLIDFLRSAALERAETGYETKPLGDHLVQLCPRTFAVLRYMGVAIPREFPKELDIGDIRYDDNESTTDLVLHRNPYSSLIMNIYLSLNDVYGFYAAYVSCLDDELDLGETSAEIYANLIDLAAAKIAVDRHFATRFGPFELRTRANYEEWLGVVKERAFREHVPLKTELLDMVYSTYEKLGGKAERGTPVGSNSSPMHPDIYMDELLAGMRTIQRTLPAIMKTLGIDDESAEATARPRAN